MYSYYKMKDIVDYSDKEKFEEVPLSNGFIEHKEKDTGEDVGCELCYCHEKATEKLKDTSIYTMHSTYCPICGTELEPDPMVRIYGDSDHDTDVDSVVVGEMNGYKPDDDIGFYPVLSCPKCKEKGSNNDLFALIPEHISWNANHNVYYTGGKEYVNDDDLKELVKDIGERVKHNIQQYVTRKVEENDSSLRDWNWELWNEYDIEHCIAEFMYKKGYKK